MQRYCIIADDFTGANDTGVQLCRRGLAVNVYLHGNIPHDGASVVVDTESRALPPQAARERLDMLLDGMDFSRFDCIIKKVDSTLRGAIATEVHTLDQLCGGFDCIVFAPAFPDMGRTTVNGVHRVGGVPVASTELARDPQNPVHEDNIAALLRQCYADVVSVGLEEVRRGPDMAQGRVFACDAETNGDLRAVIAAARATGKRVLWVGAAGLADNLLEETRRTPPALAVAGSLSSVTREQVAHAVTAGAALVGVRIYEALGRKELAAALCEEACTLLAQGKDVVLAPSSVCGVCGAGGVGEYEKNAAAAAALGLADVDMSVFTRELLGSMACRILRRCAVSGLFLTGGDTAMGFFHQVGVLGSSILEEAATGIPLMRLMGGEFDGLKVITKAGAFGGADALTWALRKLKETKPCAISA